MATAQKKPVSTDKSPKAQEATALLKADHKAVDLLFQQYEAARSSTKKKALVSQICTELTVHAQIEEEIFYPPVQAELKDKELIPEAIVEHATLKDLIAQIEDGNPEDALYDAKVKVLSEYVKHHVKEEQNELFPKVKASKLDLYALGEQLAQRKEELMAKP
ncbi:hemerythrin domain-containing protein [Cellvibrio sp. KY-YJ-3]|jgi:hemerythrin superfamily protein|uniref:hemerythrin domain-containing protein n=1 Tax=Cellvibrio sp. KY-YJ-3 TaxID=454662 RepID=UPI001244FACF|nr:hemerythrin domain-containing protein [Cellvibrio sp. KY-YJ-3]QEY14036.1 hemerythrin domain-containing protein [Cellvibrio sp. KY-YJ-3]